MKRLLAYLALILATQSVGVAQEIVHADWQVADIGPGVKPSFDFDAGDQFHIMGMTEDPDNGRAWYVRAATIDGPWEVNTISEGYFYGPGDLRVDQAGTSHIAFHDHINQGAQHLTVTQGGQVDQLVINTPGHDGWDNSLDIDSSGNVYMASCDPSQFGGTHGLQIGVFDGSSWSFESSIPGSGEFMYGLNTSIALDSAGTPQVLYCRSNDWTTEGDLVHATSATPDWQFTTIDSGVGVGRFPSLAIDANDRLHATWIDVDAEDQTAALVRYGCLDPGGGGVWDIETVAGLDAAELGFSGARKSSSIALDSNGNPHIAYSDTDSLGYAVLGEDGSWQNTPLLQHSLPIYKSMTVLRLDSKNRPGIVFWQSETGLDTVRLLRVKTVPATPLDLGLEVEVSAGIATISYQTDAAGSYQIQRSGDLGGWMDFGDPFEAGSEPVDVTETDPDPGVRQYYRVLRH